MLERWDPWQEMLSLRDAMNRLMEEAFVAPSRLLPSLARETGTLLRPSWGAALPEVDVREEDNQYVLHASLPGVRPEDVNITVRDNTVTISGQAQEERAEERGRYIYRERRTGSFSRTLTLPTEVNAENAQADFTNGVLTLTLPKAETARQRRIPIRTTGQTGSGS
jgi:HSP20 family protein